MAEYRLPRNNAPTHHLQELRALAVTFLSFGQVVKARAVLSVALALDGNDPSSRELWEVIEKINNPPPERR